MTKSGDKPNVHPGDYSKNVTAQQVNSKDSNIQDIPEFGIRKRGGIIGLRVAKRIMLSYHIFSIKKVTQHAQGYHRNFLFYRRFC